MEKKVKPSKRLTVVIACVAIILSLICAVGGTLALFSANVWVADNVLQAGNLDVKLERISLQSTHLTEQGILEEGQEVVETVDFTNSSKNVFGLTSNDVIVPGSKYVAKMKLTNTGSVAFNFTASLQIADNDNAKKLSEQLTLKLYDVNGNELTGGTVLAGPNQADKEFVFTVVLTFNHDPANNTVMDAGAKVNLLITCTQNTGL